MYKLTRSWIGWVLSSTAVVLAGLLGGWMFSPPDPNAIPETTVPVVSQEPQKQSATPSTPKRENRLAKETSPYLLLHKHNPIDWYPWGPEALEKAKREDKLIFLSIGYSSCFWCHVMERESFNDAEIAAVLNESFVCIKVDREELPDVDETFMTFVQISNRGRGGWPLTVFLTPDAKPIAGSTYFPPRERDGIPGLVETLAQVLNVWNNKREAIIEQADTWTRALQSMSAPRAFSFRQLDRRLVQEAVEELAGEFDPEFGGFGFDPRNGQRPKFPQPCVLELFNYHAARTGDNRSVTMLTQTLHHMSQGGIWDCVGGGFHRYSVDRYWHVPHFEKMLYDNAQLARVYLHAFGLTKDRVFRHMALRIFDFVKREMTSPDGAFYSALDAESEHEEGKYYVWSKQEVQMILDPTEFIVFSAVQMKGPPNFEGDRYVPQLGDLLESIAQENKIDPGTLAGIMERAAAKLLAARQQRVPPLLDTKILTDWNGLMIAALADGYRILGDEAYRDAAEKAAAFILAKSRDADGRLFHVNTGGTAKIPGYLDDYAFLLDGLVALHRATKDDRWLKEAKSIADQMNQRFWDASDGGYFQTERDGPIVIARMKPTEDTTVPSGNSAAALALVRLAQASRDTAYAERAGRTLAAFTGAVARSPGRWPHMVRALGEYLDAQFAPEPLAARPPNLEPQVVQARTVVQQKKVAAGGEIQFEVAIDIEREWHIYANGSSSPQYSPTVLEVTSALPLKNIDIQYPRPRNYQPDGVDESVSVYSDRGQIRVTATLDPSAPIGAGEIQLSLRYQACNDQRCLAPKTIKMTIPIEVVDARSSPPESSRQSDPNSPDGESKP
jgi:uncharacterized protein YyaL (SSP411 family)